LDHTASEIAMRAHANHFSGGLELGLGECGREAGYGETKEGRPETWFPAAFLMSDFIVIGLYARNP